MRLSDAPKPVNPDADDLKAWTKAGSKTIGSVEGGIEEGAMPGPNSQGYPDPAFSRPETKRHSDKVAVYMVNDYPPGTIPPDIIETFKHQALRQLESTKRIVVLEERLRETRKQLKTAKDAQYYYSIKCDRLSKPFNRLMSHFVTAWIARSYARSPWLNWTHTADESTHRTTEEAAHSD